MAMAVEKAERPQAKSRVLNDEFNSHHDIRQLRDHKDDDSLHPVAHTFVRGLVFH
jgi:hypothetical protein